tara:strand:- start:6 stop:245 length:240 start_codon:yes stop_codon:yes gene_type:complete
MQNLSIYAADDYTSHIYAVRDYILRDIYKRLVAGDLDSWIVEAEVEGAAALETADLISHHLEVVGTDYAGWLTQFNGGA